MTTKSRHITSLLWALVLIVGLGACTPWNEPEQDDPDAPQQIFKLFWNQMDQRYTCFAEHPVNWDSIYYTCLPIVSELQNTEDLVPVMQEIVNSIKDPELYVVSSSNNASLFYYPQAEVDNSIGDFSIPYTGFNYFVENRNMEYYPSHGFCTFHISHKKEGNQFRFAYIITERFQNAQTGIYKQELEKLLQEHVDGCIVDLRNNHVSEFRNMMAFARMFFEGERTVLQTAKRESRDDRFAMTSLQPYSVTGSGVVPDELPIVLIVNNMTFGPANICTHILNSLPNVIVIGRTPTSGGGAETSRISLTHNWVLHFSNGVKYFINGRSCELPLRPNVTVNPSDAIYSHPHQNSEYLYINAPLATAIKFLENLSSHSPYPSITP